MEFFYTLISLRVPPTSEAVFNDFYHHRYIPALLRIVPEIQRVWRFEEFGVTGSLRWFNKEFWTLYELQPGFGPDDMEAALKRPGRAELVEEWKRFAAEALHDVSRTHYRAIYEHPRKTWDGPFGSRPFFCVSVETDPAQTEAFNAWYHSEYLPKIMADVPAWAAVRRYQVEGGDTNRVRTIYEVNHLQAFDEAFAAMRAPHRYRSNADWDAWVGRAITWQDATSFRPIFRFPG